MRNLIVGLPTWRRVTGLAAAAVLAAGTAILAAPQQAQAYDASVWDRVALCESTNRWDINTGNGYHGGLQFSPRTWRAFGGGTYADTADRATKAEQIAVARRVLAVQGPGAWPVCSRRAGLTRATGGADRNAQPAGSSTTKGKQQTRQVTPKKPVTRPARPGGSAGSGKVVTVRSGDTLSHLARRHQVRGGWPAIARANDLANPNRLTIGQRLLLPR